MADNDRTVSSSAGVVWMYVGSFSIDTPPPPHEVINTAGPTASNATRMAFIAEPPELRFCEVACYSGRTKCLRIHHHWPLSHRKLALGSLLLGGGSWPAKRAARARCNSHRIGSRHDPGRAV